MDKTAIIGLWSKGKSIRGIAKALGASKNTIKRCVREYESAKARMADEEDPAVRALMRQSAFGKPKMDGSKRKAKVFAGKLKERFEELCRQDERRDAALGESRKQRLNAAVLRRELASEGYEISERTVRARLAERRSKAPEVFVKQSYEYGERADFDFHQEKVLIGGEVTVVRQAAISCPKSNHVYVALLKDEKIGWSKLG